LASLQEVLSQQMHLVRAGAQATCLNSPFFILTTGFGQQAHTTLHVLFGHVMVV
jgi:hypothetical protein